MDLYTLQMSLAWRARTFDGPSAVEVDKKASQSEEETNGKGLSLTLRGFLSRLQTRPRSWRSLAKRPGVRPGAGGQEPLMPFGSQSDPVWE